MRAYNINICRASALHVKINGRRAVKTARLRTFTLKNTLFNGSRRRFYSSPSTFCSFVLWPSTSYPCNPVPSSHRNRGKQLRPCKPEQAPQNAFRTPCICTVKKAFHPLPFSWLLLYYTPSYRVLQGFFAYKMAFPCKKLSKNPPTSKPDFSKQPTNCCGVAI